MQSITWLHLADLHLRAEDLKAWDEDVVLRALLEDVRGQMEEGLAPDLILVAGDISFSGRHCSGSSRSQTMEGGRIEPQFT